MTHIRPTEPSDAAAIHRIAASERLFDPDEVDCVDELLGDYLTEPNHNGYFFLTAEQEGEVIAFACYGPTPLTKGTYDLYWICVEEEARGHGLGRLLIEQVEEAVRHLGGRLLVLDTSGRLEYTDTRVFYEKMGFQRVATVPEFYAPGDDLVIYAFKLATG